jgi:tetratricopeptide (TPR) repeat protein
VNRAAGINFGILGALDAFPRRLAAREVGRQNGHLRSGVTRTTTHVVFGRKLLARLSDAEIAGRFDAQVAAGRSPVSENGFLRMLGIIPIVPDGSLDRTALLNQSQLSERDFSLLATFDAFEHEREPFSFRDVILAKKYSGLIAGGAGWGAIARSIHRVSGPVTSLTALSLEASGRDAVYARLGEHLSELDGQMLLPMDRASDDELEDLFEAAEEAETEERFADAAALYEKCLSLDPTDAVAQFNLANNLGAAGRTDEARLGYLKALKLDPAFGEAWFNLAGLEKEGGNVETARRHLLKAIAVDAAYGDAVYNLATLEFDAGELQQARHWWKRYLELDSESGWARNAIKGIHYVDLQLTHRNAG